MSYAYYYSINDWHGLEYEDAAKVKLNEYFDFENDHDIKNLAERCASDFFHHASDDNTDWVEGKEPLKVKIWLDKSKTKSYNVWVDWKPYFTALDDNGQ